ncbi:MAG: TRAP transporter large permease [Halomonas sp.]|nr:TRAP transporter large permease [Halomonas sp.]
MEALWGCGLLLGLMLFGVPIAWSFAGVLAYLVVVYEPGLSTLMLQGFRSINSVVIVALPLFVLTGYLMQSGGIAKKLVVFIETLIGGRRGGMGASMVVAAGVFGAIAGTSTAAVASIGKMMIGPLEKKGYPRGYSSAILGISSLLGILIPPSIIMILFGVATRQSVAALFAASVIPALILIFLMVVLNRFLSGKLYHEKIDAAKIGYETHLDKGKSLLQAIPALTMPVIILGGIYGGFFTPTEAAAVAVVSAVLIGFCVYREMSLKSLYHGTVDAAETTGTIMLILLFSFMIGGILSSQGIPQDLADYVSSLVQSPWLVVLTVSLFLVIIGALVDDVTVTVVVAPLLLPLMVTNGVDPVHYAAIVATSVVIGANSPPVAPILYMACKVGDVSIHKAIAPALLFMSLAAFPTMLITAYVPEVALFLPRLFGLL